MDHVTWLYSLLCRRSRDVMINIWDCYIALCEFELQLHYNAHFWKDNQEKAINPLSTKLWIK